MLTSEFAEAIAPVVRWAKEQGWQWTYNGLADDGRNPVGFDVNRDHGADGWLYRIEKISTISGGYGYGYYTPASAGQAVDVLVALGLLPTFLSSQYRRGVGDGEWVAASPTPADPDWYQAQQAQDVMWHRMGDQS